MMYQYNVSINQLPQSYNNPNNDLEFLCFINYCSEKKGLFEKQHASTYQHWICVHL